MPVSFRRNRLLQPTASAAEVFVGQLVCVRDEQAPPAGAISKAAALVQGLGPCVKWSNTLAFCMRGIDWWLRRRALVRRQRQQP